MKAFGFTLNNMTLLALSLANGIVIDDAIVVLENIYRYVEEKGVTPKEAAAQATGEIGMAVMATTLSLVVIFLPVVFITGTIGQYLFSFGIASAAAVLFSMFVSFTLTQALCARWLRSTDAQHKTSKSQGFYAALDRALTDICWPLNAEDGRHDKRGTLPSRNSSRSRFGPGEHARWIATATVNSPIDGPPLAPRLPHAILQKYDSYSVGADREKAASVHFVGGFQFKMSVMGGVAITSVQNPI